MQLLLYYALLFVVTVIAVGWLWRKGRGHTRLATAFYFLLGLILLASLLSFSPVYVNDIFPIVLQLLFGVTVFVGIGLRRRWILLFVGVGLLLYFVPFVPVWDMLAWGLLTAVPLLTINFVQNKRTPIPALVAEELVAGRMQPVGSTSHLSAEMILSEQPILECLTDGILVCSRSGLLFSVNQAATVILGRAEDKLIGRPVTDILLHFPQIDTQLSDAERMRTFAMNGRTIQGQMNLIYDAQGSAHGSVFVLRDVTTEYEARQAADSFLTTVSHELRTPLTAIKGYLELLEMTFGSNITESQQLFMETIQRNVTRTVQLVNSLIFASAIKGGRQEFRSGVADVPQLIRQLCREQAALAEQQKQQIVVEMDERVGQIDMDPIHLATILEELLSNGLKYGRSAGIMRVTATLESGEFVVISVIDDGIGIAEADQARIFEAFFHPEGRDEQIRVHGIGMGLSIVRALVEAYNGRIWFTSIPEQGTTFTFILPVAQPKKPTPLAILKSPV